MLLPKRLNNTFISTSSIKSWVKKNLQHVDLASECLESHLRERMPANPPTAVGISNRLSRIIYPFLQLKTLGFRKTYTWIGL